MCYQRNVTFEVHGWRNLASEPLVSVPKLELLGVAGERVSGYVVGEGTQRNTPGHSAPRVGRWEGRCDQAPPGRGNIRFQSRRHVLYRWEGRSPGERSCYGQLVGSERPCSGRQEYVDVAW